jgi:type IV pilus assembly protein PilY1
MMTMQPRISRISAAALTVAAVTFAATSAFAQTAVKLQLPNAILLVDSSASMEFVADPASGKDTAPNCNPNSSGGKKEMSKWIDLIEVLTGTIVDPRCEDIDRSSQKFLDLYKIGSVNPADYGFSHPHHRVLSGTCAASPDPGAAIALQNSPHSFPNGWLRFHAYDDTSATCNDFDSQAPDGLLDTFKDNVRFSLMTFDGKKGEQTGENSGIADFQGGVDGLWSYYLNNAASGRPLGCLVDQTQELGARNMYAPPWEGRMVILPAADADGAAVRKTNEQIQQVLLATRPFGATPIAALLADSQAYLTEDDASTWPSDLNRDDGPKDDAYVKGKCRPQINILLTDGEPNMEMRPSCEGGAQGDCPYTRSWETAEEMFNADPSVETFVIGFGLPSLDASVDGIDSCAELTKALIAQGKCADLSSASPGLKTCCVLTEIAHAGGQEAAAFPTTQAELAQALSAALSIVVDKTTRTTPVVSSAGSAGAVGSRMFSEFTPRHFNLWQGVLQRERWECKDGVAEAQDVDVDAGDDFVHNVNQAKVSRDISTVVATNVGGSIYSERTIRPFVDTDDDGIGVYKGVQHWFDPADVDDVSPAAMAVAAGECADVTAPSPTASECRDLFLKWTLGTSDARPNVKQRCEGSICSLVADIIHSTPAIVDSVPPDGIADETHERFISEMLVSKRPTALYTSTNDGFFHGFDMNVDKAERNELFAFIPPAVLPSMKSQYGGVRRQLLDGVPVIREVVAKPLSSPTDDPVYQRGLGDADTGTWRTVAIQGFGPGRGGYFALDITDPERKSNDANSGPRFLWQLTKGKDGKALFGALGATPLITTVFAKLGDDPAREIPVAVLPGGDASPIAGTCDRPVTPELMPGTPSSKIHCYGSSASDLAAQSLTVVRLDTGEILRTFRHPNDVNNNDLGVGVLDDTSPLRSPMTGTPVAYPGRTGAVADRVFVGDRDGTLWRLDTSDPNPEEWRLEIFFDAYSDGALASDRQPIMTAPVLSVTAAGDVTVAFSTGDQEVVTATNDMKNYIWSVTEKRTGKTVESSANWFELFENGQRVTGPMAIFNKVVYFSTFAPQTVDSETPCKEGVSEIWGLHYLESDGANGGKGMIRSDPDNPVSTLVPSVSSSEIVDAADADRAVIFGVAVAQQPTCQSSVEEPDLEGAYLGYATGTFASAAPAAKGAFELVVDAGAAGRGTRSLAPPSSPVLIDSWVGVTE